jgi:hypothetical protein
MEWCETWGESGERRGLPVCGDIPPVASQFDQQIDVVMWSFGDVFFGGAVGVREGHGPGVPTRKRAQDERDMKRHSGGLISSLRAVYLLGIAFGFYFPPY